jgi:hypothetical protein
MGFSVVKLGKSRVNLDELAPIRRFYKEHEGTLSVFILKH